MEEEQIEKIPDLDLQQLCFLLTTSDELSTQQERNDAKQKLLDAIKENNMLPYYRRVCEQFHWPLDSSLVETMTEHNDKKVKELNDKVEDAEKNLGENEIRDTMVERAKFYASIADKENTLSSFSLTEAKAASSSQKLETIFTIARTGFFWDDLPLVSRKLEQAEALLEVVGDWDHRNRSKVYRGLYNICIRDFKGAALLLLETLSTFTCYELFDYNTFIFYTVLTSIVSLDRPTLKSKVIDAPEVLSAILNIPHLSEFLHSFYDSNYRKFFQSLAQILDRLKRDRYLAQHARYFCREMRIRAYSQLLESYRSVQMSSMADAFGVSVEFLDRELSRFIASGRLHCKIDKVGGVVETNRPDAKNALYQATIKHGDLLLNRIQKLARVI